MAADANGLGVTGSSPQIGKAIVESAMASAVEQTTPNGGDFFGYIDGGTLAVKRATGSNLSGKIMLERGINAPMTFAVTIKGSTVAGENEKVVLFSHTAYAASCGEVCLSNGSTGLSAFTALTAGSPSASGTSKWFIGADDKCGIHRTKALVELMYSTGLNLGALRIQRMQSSANDIINIAEIVIKRGNFVGDTVTVQTINVPSQFSPQDLRRDMVDIGLTGASKRLDKDTWYEMIVPALENYRLNFTVHTYFQYL
jgi:hypothetical protein